MERRRVDANGALTGLDDLAGEDVVVLRAPPEPLARALLRSRGLFEDARRFVQEHRDLTERQLQELRARHGDAAGVARAAAKQLGPAELKAHARELNHAVETRLTAFATDLERRYAALEDEVESTLERLFGPTADATSGHTDATAAATDEAPRDEDETRST